MDTTDTSNAFIPLLHPDEAANYLGLHEKAVIKMARTGQLPALRLGKHWRFRATDLTRWVDERGNSVCQLGG